MQKRFHFIAANQSKYTTQDDTWDRYGKLFYFEPNIIEMFLNIYGPVPKLDEAL